MDDWGTSVWDTPINPVPPQPTLTEFTSSTFLPPSPKSEPPSPFDDFADFGQASEPAPDGDDFGDFGDTLGENQALDFGDDRDLFQDAQGLAPQLPASWEPLRLDPLPGPAGLSDETQELLAPIWPHINTEIMTQEDIRQVEGIGQILITSDSRVLYQTLFSVSPAAVTRPPNWTRSRIRRQHLIALGIPINLDEVLPQANGKPLPTLNITTRPSSAPPGPRPAPQLAPPRSDTPQPSTRSTQSPPLGLGPKPKLDDAKIAQILDLNPDTLPLLPLATLEAHLDMLRRLTKDTSSLLSYLLQTREALLQDSETYNGLIAELVGEAQKIKTGFKSKAGTGKRGSGMG